MLASSLEFYARARAAQVHLEGSDPLAASQGSSQVDVTIVRAVPPANYSKTALMWTPTTPHVAFDTDALITVVKTLAVLGSKIATVNAGEPFTQSTAALLEPAPTILGSSFDALVQNELDRDGTHRLIGYVRTDLGRALRRATLRQRVEHLLGAAEDDGYAVSPKSLQQFVRFLANHTDLKYPDVVVTPAGNFRAEWWRSRKSHIGIEFLPVGESRFVVFAPSPDKGAATVRFMGTSRPTLLAAADLVEPLESSQLDGAMKGEVLPEGHHVARYCGATSIAEDGRVTAAAFLPRPAKGRDARRRLPVGELARASAS